MGLLNDVRFYLMIAIAALFLIVVGMCSSAYDSGTDEHQGSDVSHSDTDSNEGHGDTDTAMDADVEDPKEEDASAENATDAVVTDESTTETGSMAGSVATDAASTAMAADTQDTDSANTTESSATETEAAQEDETGTSTESTAMAASGMAMSTMKKKGFELSELANTGEKIPDLATDLGNLKSDISRYSDRINEMTGMIDKLKN